MGPYLSGNLLSHPTGALRLELLGLRHELGGPRTKVGRGIRGKSTEKEEVLAEGWGAKGVGAGRGGSLDTVHACMMINSCLFVCCYVDLQPYQALPCLASPCLALT